MDDRFDVPRRLSSLHARAICHATEDLARVEQALRSVVGDAPQNVSRTEGHHGNPIHMLESTVDDEKVILGVLGRIAADQLRQILSTASSRIDESCNLHVRFDKQAAYGGTLLLAGDGDIISARVKVRAFPAKPEVAAELVTAIIDEILSVKDEQPPGQGP